MEISHNASSLILLMSLTFHRRIWVLPPQFAFCSHFHHPSNSSHQQHSSTFSPTMVFFKPHFRTLSEQLDHLAKTASAIAPPSREDDIDYDLEAQLPRNPLSSTSSFRSLHKPFKRTYGAAGDDAASFTSIRPLHSAFGPRLDTPVSAHTDLHSLSTVETTVPRSPQASFESLAPLAPRLPWARILAYLWKSGHPEGQRTLSRFHKCLAILAVTAVGGAGVLVATGHSQYLLSTVSSILCWVEDQLGLDLLPFCQK